MIQILTTVAGSRAYHMERESSDWDYHTVYITPTQELLKLGPTPKSTRWDESPDNDTQGWELGHFLHLATKCNPTILETFVAPTADDRRDSIWDSYGQALRALFPCVLARKRVRDAFRGYAHNQRTKIFKKPDDPTADQPTERVWKFATQYLRVLLMGERLLRTHEMVIDMREYEACGSADGLIPGYTQLLNVRDGLVTLGSVINMAQAVEAALEDAYAATKMQDEPNLDAVNDFLLHMRKVFW